MQHFQSQFFWQWYSSKQSVDMQNSKWPVLTRIQCPASACENISFAQYKLRQVVLHFLFKMLMAIPFVLWAKWLQNKHLFISVSSCEPSNSKVSQYILLRYYILNNGIAKPDVLSFSYVNEVISENAKLSSCHSTSV